MDDYLPPVSVARTSSRTSKSVRSWAFLRCSVRSKTETEDLNVHERVRFNRYYILPCNIIDLSNFQPCIVVGFTMCAMCQSFSKILLANNISKQQNSIMLLRFIAMHQSKKCKKGCKSVHSEFVISKFGPFGVRKNRVQSAQSTII